MKPSSLRWLNKSGTKTTEEQSDELMSEFYERKKEMKKIYQLSFG